MSKIYEKKPGDENKNSEKVKGAEEYLVGHSIDCMFTLVKTSEYEARKKNKDVNMTVFGKFEHRCEAEEYAKFLHSGKTLKHEVCGDEVRKELVEAVKRILTDAITESICVGFEYGKSKANADLLERLGLQECVKALPPCGDHHKAGEALGAKYGNIFGEALLRFFGNDNVSDGKDAEASK